MPERITNEQFFSHIDTLQQGDVARHAMLFPGVYPSDMASHENAKTGVPFEPASPYYETAGAAIRRGVRMEWLRVMPEAGQFGYAEEDIQAMLLNASVIARFGHDVRVVTFNSQRGRIVKHCGSSPIAADYMAGVERGEPRKSSWAMYRRRMGGLAVAYLDTMDYEAGGFKGHVRHAPTDQHVAGWAAFWRDTYEHYARPVTLRSS